MPIEESTPARLTTSDLRDVYSRLAPLYGVWELLGTGRARRAALDLARVRSGDKVLEIAAGPGTALEQLAGANASGITVGVDLTPAMLQRTRRLFRRLRRSLSPLCQCDARLLPFKGEIFDLVYSGYMLDALAVSDMEKALDEMRRVLKPAGRLVLLSLSSSNRRFNFLWEILYWIVPNLLGGCRPIRLASYLTEIGFSVVDVRHIKEWGIPVEVVVAHRGVKVGKL